MSALEKVGKKVTVKDLNLQLKILLEKITKLEEREVEKDKKLKNMENTIKGNKEKIVKLEKMLNKGEANKLCKDVELNCKECGESFPGKSDLTKHIKQNHAKEYKCKICEKTFSQSWSFELHTKSHEEMVPFKCNTCDKDFYSKWRLNKHVLSHSENGKFCHYFNNGKSCPFEEIGCKFKHEVSKNCRYDKKCHIKLCQFIHSPGFELKENDKEVSDKENGDKYIKYNQMDEYEQFDVYQEICLTICWSGYHKCQDHDEDNELLGVDVVKIRDDYNNRRKEKFHCEKCNYLSTDMEDVKNHFMAKHEKVYSCWECEEKFTTITEFKMHYGSFHYSVEESNADSI